MVVCNIIPAHLAHWMFKKRKKYVEGPFAYIADRNLRNSGNAFGVLNITSFYCPTPQCYPQATYHKQFFYFKSFQIFNFLLSVPQIFHLVPCPRHRLPKYDPETDLMTPSTFQMKSLQELNLAGTRMSVHLSLGMFVYTTDTEIIWLLLLEKFTCVFIQMPCHNIGW